MYHLGCVDPLLLMLELSEFDPEFAAVLDASTASSSVTSVLSTPSMSSVEEVNSIGVPTSSSPSSVVFSRLTSVRSAPFKSSDVNSIGVLHFHRDQH